MKKRYLILPLISLVFLASCAVQTPVVTDASYTTYHEINCNNQTEEIYVFYETPTFQYSEIGQMTITSQSANPSYTAKNKEQKSMQNMAAYVAWTNCADGIIEVKQYPDSLTAMAITFNKTLLFKT